MSPAASASSQVAIAYVVHEMRFFFVLLLVFVATGCSVKTSVEVKADPNGSGTVAVILVMNAEAAAAAGNLDSLRGTDLVDAGWQFSQDDTDGGGKTLTVSHDFSSVDEANSLMAQLTGEGGAFSGFKLAQSSSGLTTKSSFDGSVDLTQGIASFGDASLLERTGSRLGFDPNEFFSEYSTTDAQAFPVSVKVSLPGSTDQASPQLSDGQWNLAYGQVNPLELESSGIEWKILVYAGLGLAFIVGAIATFLLWKVEKDEYVPRHIR